jgi:ABC-2 type transport system permease protein
LLLSLMLGIAMFEVLIVVITAAVPADELLSAKPAPDAFEAFSGSSGGVSLASTAGLLGAGLIHPIWVAIQLSAVASFGAAAVAADIEERTIELLAVRPISRLRLLGERLAAAVIASASLSVACIVPIWAGVQFSGRLHDAVATVGYACAFLSGFVLMLAFTGFAIALSCNSRRRSSVLSGVAGFAAIMYAINFAAEAWHPARDLRWTSLFYYYRPADALVSGVIPWRNIGVLLVVFAVGVIVGALRLQRRDLTR